MTVVWKDGESLDIPQGPRLQRALLDGWAAEPGTQVMVTGQGEDGLDTEAMTPDEFVQRYVSTGGRLHLLDVQDTGRIIEGRQLANREQIQIDENEGAVVTGLSRATAFTNELSFGLGEGLARALSPTAGEALDAVRERDPMGTMIARGAGMLASFALPGAAGVGGVARLAGQAASAGRTGIRAMAARNLAEGAVFSGGLAIQDAIASNRPLVASQIATDAGLDAAIGFGADLLLAGAGRGYRAVRDVLRRTPSGRNVVHGGRLAAGTQPPLNLNTATRGQLIAAAHRHIPDDFGDPMHGSAVMSELQRVFATAGEGQAIRYNSREFQRLIAPAFDALETVHAPRVAGTLSELETTFTHGIARDGMDARRFDEFYRADFAALDNAGALPHLQQQVSERARRVADGLVESANSGSMGNAAGTAQALADDMRRFADDAMTARNAEDLYTRLRSFESGMSGRVQKAFDEKAGVYANNILKDAATDVTGRVGGPGVTPKPGIRADPALWGQNIVEGEIIRGRLLGGYKERTGDLFKKIQGKSYVPGERVEFKVDKIASILAQTGKGKKDDIITAIVDHTTQTLEDAKAYRARFPSASSALNNLEQRTEELLRQVAAARKDSEIVASINAGLAKETKMGQAGVGSLLGGALVGGAAYNMTDDPAWGLAGVAGSMGVWHALRPASSAMRMGAMRNAYQRAKVRITGAQGSLRKSLKSKARAPSVRTRLTTPAVYAFQNQQERDESFRGLQRDLLDMNPAALQEHIAVSTEATRMDDPELADEMANVYVRSFLYLQRELPRTNTFAMSDTQVLPSATEMDSFIEKYMAVQDPISMLEDFVNGSLTIEKATAVREVHPEMFAELTNDVIEVVSEFPPEQIPYQYRIQMSTLLGVPTDPTLSAEFGMAMQVNGYQTAEQAKAVSGQLGANPSIVTNTLSRNQQALEEPL